MIIQEIRSIAIGLGLSGMVIGVCASVVSGFEPVYQCEDMHEERILIEEIDPSVFRGGGLCDECVIEIHILVDVLLADELGDSVQDYVDEIIAGMNETWSRPFSDGGLGLGVVLSELTVFENGDPWVASSDAFVMINNVQAYVDANIPINPDGRDAVIMLSGVQFDIGFGVGFVGELCQPNAVGIVEAISLSNEFVVSIANHQLGHIVGSMHDGPSGNAACTTLGFIMGAPNLSLPADRFSSCSISSIVGELLRPGFDMISCLAPPQVSCLADLTDDGSLDFFDISAFLTAFTNEDPIADFTDDSTFDFFDISAFLTVFGAGCP